MPFLRDLIDLLYWYVFLAEIPMVLFAPYCVFIFLITVGYDVFVHITCFSEFYFHVKSERFGIFG